MPRWWRCNQQRGQMKQITVDDILSLEPYTSEELEAMFKAREDLFTEEQLLELARKFAGHVKHLDNSYLGREGRE